MTSVNPNQHASFPIQENEHEIRVRYQETDAQGRVHHANFINYFEIGRTEMLRAAGSSYRQLEESGLMLVVTDLGCSYAKGARYDDLLTIRTTIDYAKGVRIKHDYEIRLGDEVLATGWTIVAAIDPNGKVVRLPPWLRIPAHK